MKIVSEIIEVNEKKNDNAIGISKWFLHFIPQPIVLKHHLLHTSKYLNTIKNKSKTIIKFFSFILWI